MAYIENKLARDESNWWAPNHACVEALLRTTGFRVTARPDHEFYFCEVAGAGDARARDEFQQFVHSVSKSDAR